MTRKEAWITLNLAGISRAAISRLIDYFEDPEEILKGTFEEISQVTTARTAKRIEEFKFEPALEQELNLMDRTGVRVITIEDPEYPENLKNIYDPPILLYVLGKFQPEDRFSLSIVGSRRATHYGKRVADSFAQDLVKAGFAIISGMARGIDSIAHRAALHSSGRTIAVLGSGLNVVYPPENYDLMQQIAGRGAVISEFPMNTPPERYNFPIRNRIISGLGLGCLVVEAGDRSGTSITINCALEQGREVFAVPGPITSFASKGTNNSIKQGAKLTQGIEDIIEELIPQVEGLAEHLADWYGSFKSPAKAVCLTKEEKLVYNAAGEDPCHIDEIIQKVGLGAGKTLGILMTLETKGAVIQSPGKLFSRQTVVIESQ
jgi:DNA processing protein